MRIATYNVEWFAHLFDDTGRLAADAVPSARHGVTRADQIAALGTVFRALDADGVLVVEAPETNARRQTVPQMQAFASHFGLRARRAVTGFVSQTQQEICFLYDPDVLDPVHDPRASTMVPRFDGTHRVDLDLDGQPDPVRFAKPPLELAVRTARGEALRLIGVHLKSKIARRAKSDAAATRLAIESRRKQLAQCLWLRDRVLEHLFADEQLIVLGDLNDGPGLDEYEALFGRSGVEIVLGWDEPRDTRLFDPHAKEAFCKKGAASPSTARFYQLDGGRFFSALIDYVMVSPGIRARKPRWRIWHPFDDPAIYRDAVLRDALLAASDHFPVSIDLG